MDHLKRLGLRAWIIYGPRGNISGKDETILVFSGSIVAIYVMNCLGDMWETAVLLRDLIVLDSFCMKGQGIAVKFAFMKIVFCTVAFFILFSFILYIYIYIVWTSGFHTSILRLLCHIWTLVQLFRWISHRQLCWFWGGKSFLWCLPAHPSPPWGKMSGGPSEELKRGEVVDLPSGVRNRCKASFVAWYSTIDS